MKGWQEDPYQAHPRTDAEFTKFLRKRIAEREREHRRETTLGVIGAVALSILIWLAMVWTFLTVA